MRTGTEVGDDCERGEENTDAAIVVGVSECVTGVRIETDDSLSGEDLEFGECTWG